MMMTTTTNRPTIDPQEIRWATGELAQLMEHVRPDSVVGMVLEQAYRELASLTQSTPAGEVVGPFRFRTAA
ncbi:MAG: hypothetical protein ACRCZF_16490 [Gemmataceae bacterium]